MSPICASAINLLTFILLKIQGNVFMKLRKPAQNEMNKELGNKPDELENILEQIETKIKKIKEMVIHEIQKTPRKQGKHRRTLKRSK